MGTLVTHAVTGEPCSDYMYNASHAVISERRGDFYQAARQWKIAGLSAVHAINEEWAGTRQAFCEMAIARRWGGQDESE